MGRELEARTVGNQPAPVTGAPPPAWKRALQGAASLAIVVGIFVGVMPQIAGYGDVWSMLGEMSGPGIAGLALVGIWNLATYWFVLVAALPGMRLREAAVVNQASTAVSNTLPGGGAIGVGVTVAMLRSWGFRLVAITRSAIVTGVWNAFVKLGMPVLALALLAIEGSITPARVVAAAAGVLALVGSVIAFGLMLRSDHAARAIGALFGRVVDRLRGLVGRRPLADWSERAARFRAETIGLLRHRWLSLTVASLISHISLYLVLLVALRNLGVSQDELSWIAVLAAFAFVRLISALPVTPGGVGVVELGYAAVMTMGMDAIASARVVAAILVFRTITYALPIPFGLISYIVWRLNRSWRLSDPERDALVGDVYSNSA